MYKLNDLFEGNIDDIQGELIYRIYNINSGKSYIGQTRKSLLSRFSGKIMSSHVIRYYNGTKSKLYNSLRAESLENFNVELLPINALLTLDENEKFYVAEFDSYYNGYNDTFGGKGFNIEVSRMIQPIAVECARQQQKGCFFNPEEHRKSCTQGGLARGEYLVKKILIILKDKSLPITKENYILARKELGVHNSPTYEKYLINYTYVTLND